MATRPVIVIVEDNESDARLIENVASRYGLAVVVKTIGELQNRLHTGGAELVILDLMLPDSQVATGTIDRVRLIYTGAVIVVTGNPDETAKRLAIGYGWSYVFKDDSLARELDRAICDAGSDQSDGTVRVKETQLTAIVGLLRTVLDNQAEYERKRQEDSTAIKRLARLVTGSETEDGIHIAGCFEQCQQIRETMNAGKALASTTAKDVVKYLVISFVGAVVALILTKLHLPLPPN